MLSNFSDQAHLYDLLARIHALMERYFDALENNLAHKDYRFEQRERDARVFSTLARTLEKLTHVEQLITEPPRAADSDAETRKRLEQRLARLIDIPTEREVS